MSVVQKVSDLAVEIAEEMQQRRSKLDAELATIEARKREIETELRAMNLGRERLSHVRANLSGQYQCPSCWVRHAIKSPLTPVPSDTKDDFFRCSKCGCEALIDRPE